MTEAAVQSNGALVEPDGGWELGAPPLTDSSVPVAPSVVHDNCTVATGQLASAGPVNETTVGGGIEVVVVVGAVVVVGGSVEDVVEDSDDVVVSGAVDAVVDDSDDVVTLDPPSRVAAAAPTPARRPTSNTTNAPTTRPPRLVGSSSPVATAPPSGTARVTAAAPGSRAPVGTARVGSLESGGPAIAAELCHCHGPERAQLPGHVGSTRREQHLGGARGGQGVEPGPEL